MKAFLISVCVILMGFAAYGFFNYYTVADPLPTHYPYLFGVMLLLGLLGLLRLTARRPGKDISEVESFSEFVQLMVDGLKARRFKIDMDTYYSRSKLGVVSGCAATHAISELTGKRPSELKDVTNLHSAYNSLRTGSIYSCLMSLEDIVSFPLNKEAIMAVQYPEYSLYNSNWKDNLHYFQEYADRLRAAGL